jgi:hypothetical protein
VFDDTEFISCQYNTATPNLKQSIVNYLQVLTVNETLQIISTKCILDVSTI